MSVMSQEQPVTHLDRAMRHRSKAVQAFNAGKAEMPAGEQALFFAMLAQFEATMEVIDRLREGVTVTGDRKLHDAVGVFDAAVRQLKRFGNA